MICSRQVARLFLSYIKTDLEKKVKEQGLTIVPTKMYFKENLVKVEIALAKGKHLYDKRQDMRKADIKRDIERAIKG